MFFCKASSPEHQWFVVHQWRQKVHSFVLTFFPRFSRNGAVLESLAKRVRTNFMTSSKADTKGIYYILPRVRSKIGNTNGPMCMSIFVQRSSRHPQQRSFLQ